MRTPNSSRASSHPHIRHHTFIAKLEGEKSRTVIAVKRDWKNELNQSDIWSLTHGQMGKEGQFLIFKLISLLTIFYRFLNLVLSTQAPPPVL